MEEVKSHQRLHSDMEVFKKKIQDSMKGSSEKGMHSYDIEFYD